jgi:hypothetical protein
MHRQRARRRSVTKGNGMVATMEEEIRPSPKKRIDFDRWEGLIGLDFNYVFASLSRPRSCKCALQKKDAKRRRSAIFHTDLAE